MKLSKRDFRNKVNNIRSLMPTYNNGRKVVVVGEDTALGKRILASASRWDGYTLEQVYDHCSEEKRRAFLEAWERYCQAEHSESFGICSHNSQHFTVSWLSDEGCTFLTYKTEYLVVFNE